ncbi:uncharacterized protein Z518_07315 [Rhinocladiella mackenziei CBS 650.93]|uniref:Uncharacterized protein n=1 Tax=Rhinocladiella mackenziei CBS 650.93 TaxID=1442369 RepID=A0A0D2FNT9_9EURO|nr:uncharacterized protein Z518_07315 [Rhinocladiella mackenziei CBS 650.93]KIX03762.1 hypothetical protein Z518_07315 [Rhinocladiella mackenziei CBS 650.93]
MPPMYHVPQVTDKTTKELELEKFQMSLAALAGGLLQGHLSLSLVSLSHPEEPMTSAEKRICALKQSSYPAPTLFLQWAPRIKDFSVLKVLKGRAIEDVFFLSPDLK